MHRKIRYISSILLLSIWLTSIMVLSFLPQFYAKGTTFQDPQYFPQDVNYSLHMLGGSSGGDSYYIQFPLTSGVNRHAIADLLKDSRLKIKQASISHLCVPFFLAEKDTAVPYIRSYIEYANEPWFHHQREAELITFAGGDPAVCGLIDLPVQWHTYESIQQDFPQIDRDDFQQGTSILAPSKYCQVGDTFTLIIPIPHEGATEENIQKNIHFEVLHTTVAATYDNPEISSLILSADYLFSVHPHINYEEVQLHNLQPQDAAWTVELEQKLQNVVQQSTNIVLDDYAQLTQDFYRPILHQLFYVIIGTLLLSPLLLLGIIRLAKEKLRTIVIIGLSLGTLLGAILLTWLTILGEYVPVQGIILTNVLPIYLLTIIIIILTAKYSYRHKL